LAGNALKSTKFFQVHQAAKFFQICRNEKGSAKVQIVDGEGIAPKTGAEGRHPGGSGCCFGTAQGIAVSSNFPTPCGLAGAGVMPYKLRAYGWLVPVLASCRGSRGVRAAKFSGDGRTRKVRGIKGFWSTGRSRRDSYSCSLGLVAKLCTTTGIMPETLSTLWPVRFPVNA